jgi:HEAT repeat protein
LDHDDATVRRQATEVLGSIPGIPPMRGVARMLRDPDAEVRMASYQVFLNRPYRGVAKVLRAVLESTDLESLGLSERKLLFSAYGAAAGPEDALELAALLAGRRSFGGRRGSSETRACAALALARIEAPSARSALTEARRSQDPVVRNAVRIALQEAG